MQPLEIGVCAWSIDRHDAVGVFEAIRGRLGLGVTQVGFFGRAAVESADPQRILNAAGAARVELSAAFVAFDGQDYSSIAAIARTGGFVPAEMWEDRFELTRRAARLTKSLGLDKLGLHMGAIPPRESPDLFKTLGRRVQQAADLLDDHGLTMLIETGPDPVDLLIDFLEIVDRTNIGVGFDPGNFITYGSGDPVHAVSQLRGRVGQVHIKDCVASQRPGVDWGSEVFPGAGEADIPRVVSKLRSGGYHGPLLIERSTGGGVGDIAECVAYLRSLVS